MKFLAGDTVDFRNERGLEAVEIATLEEFLAFVPNEAGHSVIIHPPEDGVWKLEVYNDYRE